jgi:endonuclease YncB( thermonuclease family)
MMLLSFLAATAVVSASETPAACPLPIIEQVEVKRATDTATLDLADGRRVRLAAVLAPRAGEPFAVEFHRRLSEAVAGRSIWLAFDGQTTDRYGTLIAHIFTDVGWAQQELVAAGLARVRTLPDATSCVAQLINEEAAARAGSRGLWALPRYRVRGPDDLEDDIGTFQIVEGRVAAVTVRRGRVYVNFGADYRSDFTVTIAPRDARRLAKQGVDPVSWAHKKVRVRGWLSRLNGPEMELTHAAQIQILE